MWPLAWPDGNPGLLLAEYHADDGHQSSSTCETQIGAPAVQVDSIASFHVKHLPAQTMQMHDK